MRADPLKIPSRSWSIESHTSPLLAVRLVIIRDLDFVRPVNLPDETDAVLIVDPDAVLSDAVTLERLQPIARRDAQIVQVDGRWLPSAGWNPSQRVPSYRRL
jgi:hypothetical protein